MTIALPPPGSTGRVASEEPLRARRSVRKFLGEPIAFRDAAQLLWAARGITNGTGLRTAPSAGATYPLELTLVTGARRARARPRAAAIRRRAGSWR